MTRYRATLRCIRDDLGLAEANAARDVDHYCAEHEALRVFLSKRRHDPGEGENVLDVVPYGHIKSLHIGTARAATIYDADLDVCWLLAYNETHATGERRDAYNHFVRLSGRGELLPSQRDIGALSTLTPANMIDTLRVHGEHLYEAAIAALGEEICESLVLDDGQDASIVVSIEVVVDQLDSAEQGWIAFVLPYDAPVSQNLLIDLIADLIPSHVDPDSVDFASSVNSRPVRHNELAFTWEHFATS